MPLLLLRRLAIIATPILFLAPSPHLSLSARADDAPKTAHESAVLDRIFANWKARHDRAHSLHFKWDCRTTCKKGAADFSSTNRPQALLDKDQVFEQLGAQLWIDGDDRMCVVSTPSCKVPQATSADRGRVVGRQVVVGNTTSSFRAGSWWESGTAAPRTFPRFGHLHRTPTKWRLPIYGFQPLLLTFRPNDVSVSLLREQCRLVENAGPDDEHLVKFQRTVEPQRIDGGRMAGRVETFWVSPTRDDLVVRWTSETPKLPTCIGTIRYKKDKTYGWIPSEWSCDYVGAELSEYRVTSCAINEKIDQAIFSLEFPAGTPVSDNMKGGSAKDVRYYVVEKDGSKRTISPQEYFRLGGFSH